VYIWTEWHTPIQTR